MDRQAAGTLGVALRAIRGACYRLRFHEVILRKVHRSMVLLWLGSCQKAGRSGIGHLVIFSSRQEEQSKTKSLASKEAAVTHLSQERRTSSRFCGLDAGSSRRPSASMVNSQILIFFQRFRKS